jgi:tetratricopeptide (TPR) repeat protein
VADTRIDELRRRLERDPGSRLFAQLAEELRKHGELVEAVRVARAGLAVHTAYPSARLTLGRALLDSGDPSGARVELESALRDAPDNILASRYLAQARESLGDLKGAVDQYRKTLLMAPGDRQLQGALAALEARVAAPAGATVAGAESTLPMPRQTPPPLPPGVASPARPLAPPGPEPPPGGDEVPPTLRIGSSQTVIPPAPPPQAGPAPAATPAGESATLPAGSRTLTAAGGPVGEAAPSEAAAPFSSPTLAELYYQQGLVERAVDVYRQVVQQEPENDKARTRLSELEGSGAAPHDRASRRLALERSIADLETLLEAVRRK